MLNCSQVTELVSKNLDTSLPLYQRLGIKLHLLICKTCQLYAKQIGFIHRALAEIDTHSKTVKLPDAAKKRIENNIKRAR